METSRPSLISGKLMMGEVDRALGKLASTSPFRMAKVGWLPQAAGWRRQMAPKDRGEHAIWLKGYEDALDAVDGGMASELA